MNIEWTSALETGNAIIDGEHKKLIQNVNDLLEACSKGAGRAKVAESSKFLSEYTRTHFSHEEQLQASHKYPIYETHKKWHREFSGKIDALALKLKTQEATIATVAEINTLAGQLIAHIKTMDTAFAKFIKDSK